MPKAILTDIEGTISSISFVKDVLFPYASERLEDFILSNFEHDPFLLSIIEATLEELKQDKLTGLNYDSNQDDCTVAERANSRLRRTNDRSVLRVHEDHEDDENAEIGVPQQCNDAIFETQVYTAIQALKTWIQEDRKITPLKDLQGLIWQEGFRKGLFKAPLYQDALDFFLNMKGKGLPIYVYSSGSIQAQRLFFEFSEFGDVRYLFSGFYDTKIGSKKESASYLKIANDINLNPEDILFLTDIKDECRASEGAGLLTIQVVRESLNSDMSLDSSIASGSSIERTRKVISDFSELSEIL
ncbi:MAG: acireductone synthase [Proteobacteria bacterium]|nr:acireductone synthase [Pseudomonadota bacterium]